MQQKFPKGSECAEMLTDLVRLVQNTYIPEDKQEYWNKAYSDIANYLEKYENIDRAFVEGFSDMYFNYLDIKHKSSKLNVGDRFEHLKVIYEVVNGIHGNSARFIERSN